MEVLLSGYMDYRNIYFGPYQNMSATLNLTLEFVSKTTIIEAQSKGSTSYQIWFHHTKRLTEY